MMQPLHACPVERLSSLLGVLTDIDDTLTTGGRITAEAYSALERIHRTGLILIPITGRPAGWCDHIARMWPVDAVVGENGAFWFRYDARERRVERRFVADDEMRETHRRNLGAVAALVLQEVPRARIASDQRYRDADLAIDYCEDIDRLSDAEIARVVSIMASHGLTAKVSSIHINGWHGVHDKLTTTLALLRERFGIAESDARERFAFVGDSPNDQPMFEFFSCAVGVANVREFAAQITALPRYVTDAACGAGFAEFAERVVRARQ
jgi:HAD superfamily hydrolase (TIGR01484 family)